MWDKETDPFKDFIHEYSDRWISMPVSPSAEAYSIMFFKVIDAIIQATEFNNGEKDVKLYSVRVHETTTGYAEAFHSDLKYIDFELSDIVISDAIKKEWKDPKMFDKLIDYHCDFLNDQKPFVNEVVEQQV
jgi:6-pyruvoyltetrahydropterin/6-carboxytetrahydropterin synthase